MRATIGSVIRGEGPATGVYLLELAGEDDDFAVREAASAVTDIELIAPGLATARDITERVRGLAYTHRVSEYIGRTQPAIASARELLASTPVEADRAGTVAVRAREVRGLTDIDTQAVERQLGQELVDRGFTVDLDDPDHVLRAVFSTGCCTLGWLAVESVRDFGDRAPTDRPFFQPGSMDPLLARALANIAGARSGRTILDPMCGTGGVLIEAGLVGADVVGVDAQHKMVHGAARNLAQFLDANRSQTVLPEPGCYQTIQGDATHLPFSDDAIDGIVFDAPYGRQSKIANQSLSALVAGALSDARRIAPRAVVVADQPWTDVARDAGWTITDTFERRVHRSLTRHILVLTTNR